MWVGRNSDFMDDPLLDAEWIFEMCRRNAEGTAFSRTRRPETYRAVSRRNRTPGNGLSTRRRAKTRSMAGRSCRDMLLKRRYRNYGVKRDIFHARPRSREIRRVIACTPHLAGFHASARFPARNFRRNITRQRGARRSIARRNARGQ